MKDDVKVKVPNRTPMTLILSNGVINWDSLVLSLRVTMLCISKVG
jgi:hypothetical protein